MLSLPFSDTVPLRSTNTWGSYRDVESIPMVWGRAKLAPIQYDREMRLWCCNGANSVSVDAVFVNESEIVDWIWANTADPAGQPVTIIELGTPITDDDTIDCVVRGQRRTDRDELAENPADVLLSILQWFGADYVPADVDSFRAETAAYSYAIGGVVDNRDQTRRALVSSICESLGAIWSTRLPGIAKLFPNDADTSPVYADFNKRIAQNVRASTQLQSVFTELQFQYDYDWSVGGYRRVIELIADEESVRRYGERRRVIQAPWVHTPPVAQHIAERYLKYGARPQWDVSFTASGEYMNIPPGARITLNHSLIPASGEMHIMSTDLDLEQGTVNFTAAQASGAAPGISTTSFASAFEPLIPSEIPVVYRDGRATFTIFDQAGRPLPARVTLDGQVTRITNPAGLVQFQTNRGTHTLFVEAEGYQNREFSVVV